MTIGIEAQRIFRKEKHGIDIAAIHLIAHLQELDRENQYYIFTNEGSDTACLKETKNFKIVSFGGAYAIWEQVKLPTMAKKLGCDILHCTSNTAPVSWEGILVLTVHDIIYLERNPLFVAGYSMYQRFGNLYRRLVAQKNLRRAERLITVSESERQRLSAVVNVPSGKIELIYNAAAPHFFLEKKGAAPIDNFASLGLSAPYMVHLGNSDPKKNTVQVLNAFCRFCRESDFRHKLVILDIDSEFVQRNIPVKDFGYLAERLVFPNYMTNEQLPQLLAGADVFLYPSLRESFGIPIIEAMAAGVPVVTSNISCMPEIAGGAAFLVDPQSETELVEALKTIVSDKPKWDELRKKGFKRAKDFSWKVAAEKTLQLYRSVFAKANNN